MGGEFHGGWCDEAETGRSWCQMQSPRRRTDFGSVLRIGHQRPYDSAALSAGLASIYKISSRFVTLQISSTYDASTLYLFLFMYLFIKPQCIIIKLWAIANKDMLKVPTQKPSQGRLETRAFYPYLAVTLTTNCSQQPALLKLHLLIPPTLSPNCIPWLTTPNNGSCTI